MSNKIIKIAIGITSSYHKIHDLIPIINNLKLKNYEIKLFGTPSLKLKENLIKEIEQITGEKLIYTVYEAEPFGPNNYFDIMLIAPITGNTLGKLANAITENAVLMAAKSTLRNNKPLVLAISSNDALGLNGSNLMKLLVMKNIFFVPFGQDSPLEKPNSLVADFNKIEDTIKYALNNKQIQPIIIVKNKKVED